MNEIQIQSLHKNILTNKTCDFFTDDFFFYFKRLTRTAIPKIQNSLYVEHCLSNKRSICRSLIQTHCVYAILISVYNTAFHDSHFKLYKQSSEIARFMAKRHPFYVYNEC